MLILKDDQENARSTFLSNHDYTVEDCFHCETSLDFLYISTLNTGQLNPLFHTFAEFRLIVNRIVAWQSTDWLAANAQFSPNVLLIHSVCEENVELECVLLQEINSPNEVCGPGKVSLCWAI